MEHPMLLGAWAYLGARGASNALRTMGNYPRRTMGGAAALGGAMAYKRRGSQNYPMY